MSLIHWLSSTLSAAFHPILSVLGMATQPDRCEISTGDVVSWYNLVGTLCAADPVVRERYDDPKSLPVHRIRRYKESSSSFSQHEYLVAEVIPKGGPHAYLRLERSRTSKFIHFAPFSCPDCDTDSPRRFPATTPASPSPTSTSSSSHSLREWPAVRGWVTQIPRWPAAQKGMFGARAAGAKEKITIIEEMSFKNTTIHDLIIVAYTLHVNNPEYELYSSQCHWFADVIVRVLAKCDAGSKRKSLNAVMEEELWKVEEGHYNPSSTSKWYGIPIHEAREKYLKELEELYGKQQKIFKKKAYTLITREREIEMEKRLRVEATERAERETERADMHKRLRVEATERAERETERAERETERAERETERADMHKRLRVEATERVDMHKRLRVEATERADMEKRLRAEETKRAEEEIRQLRAQLEMERRGVATTT